jgi:hypothetical protein
VTAKYCHRAVGDARVDHGHRERLVAEQGGDGVEAHAAVDRLGGKRVAKLVRGHVADAGLARQAPERPRHPPPGDRPVALDEQPLGAKAGRPVVLDPVVEQRLELGVQRDVAVGVKLPERDPKPEGRADLDHRVAGEAEQLAGADARARQKLDDKARERIGVRAGRPQELGGGRVIQEARQRLVHQRQVAHEDERPLRRARVAPLGDPLEEAAQVDEPVLDADPAERPAAGARPRGGVKPGLVVLDVLATQRGAASEAPDGSARARCRTRAGSARCERPSRGAG